VGEKRTEENPPIQSDTKYKFLFHFHLKKNLAFRLIKLSEIYSNCFQAH